MTNYICDECGYSSTDKLTIIQHLADTHGIFDAGQVGAVEQENGILRLIQGTGESVTEINLADWLKENAEPELKILQVGQPIDPAKRFHAERWQYNYDQAGHEIIGFVKNLTETEVESFRSGRLDFALVTFPPVIILSFRFAGFLDWSDAPYSWLLVHEQNRQVPSLDFEPGTGAACRLILAESPSGVVRGLRLVSFTRKFTLALHQAILDQIHSGYSQQDFDAELLRVYRSYTTRELVRMAKIKCTAGQTSDEPAPEPDGPLFDLGQIVATPGALDALHQAGADPATYLRRHLTGDWGELDAEDKQRNDEAVATGARIFSAYRLPDDTRIWLITEADRSATTFLLPEEY